MESQQNEVGSPENEGNSRAVRAIVKPQAAPNGPARWSVGHRPLLLSILLTGSLVLGTLAALTPHYETNDDVGMNAIVAGRMLVDRPDEHLLFSDILIGCGLKSLYQMAPHVPWYGGYLFLTASLSLAAVCFACLRPDHSEWNLGLTAVFLWVAGIPALTLLQFTRVAFLAGLAGLLLLAGAVRVPGGGWQKWCAVGFLLAGSLIRFYSVLLVCVVLSPVIAWMAWRACFQRSARAPLLLLFACLVVGFAAARFTYWYYDHDPAWRDFVRFNGLRVHFIDWGHVHDNPQTAPVFASVGWLPIDVQMLKSWAFLDRERFSVEKLQVIVDGVASRSQQPARPWGALFERLIADGELWGLWACGAACLAILATDRSARFVPLACYCATGVTCLLLYQRMHLPARVYCPAFSACAVTAILFSAGPRSLGKGRAWIESAWGRRAALTVIGAVIAWRGAAMFRSNANFLSFHTQTDHILRGLAPKPNQLFVVWAGGFPFEIMALPFVCDSLPRNFKVLSLDWTTRFAKARMDEFGVRDLLSIVRRGDGTYLICQKSETELLSAYFRAHYALALSYRVVFAHPSLYGSAVYRVSIAGPAPRPP